MRFVAANFVRRPGDGTRRRHSHDVVPRDDANRLGGRTAYFRVLSGTNGPKSGKKWTKDATLVNYNIDVWLGQQTLRKKWKGRNWDVVEMAFEDAPKELQRVIPEKYTELPLPVGEKGGNIRDFVVDRESIQPALYPRGQQYPNLRVTSPEERKNALSSFFSGL